MNSTKLKRVDDLVVSWMREVRTNVMKRVNQHMQVDTKSSPRDLVTNVDRETEQYYVSAIRKFDPNAKILGEEGFGDIVNDMNGCVWFVDPIDGTMNFVKQHDEFASMIALFENGKPQLGWIMDVANNVIIHGGPEFGVYKNDQLLAKPENVSLKDGLVVLSGARLLYEEFGFPEVAKSAIGYRVYGSAGISFMRVLEGKSVAYSSRMKPWDFAAGTLLANSLGLKVGTIDEEPVNMLSSSTVLVATEQAYNDIVAIERSL